MSGPARRGAAAGGVAATAAAVYVGATVLGGVLDPGYSHVSMHVSELTSSHAPNRSFLAALYVGYNLALAGFGLALLRSVLRTRALTVASASLVLTAAVGILLVTWFPQDSYGHPATTAGGLHIALAGVAALLSIVAMIAAGRAFRSDERWAPLARMSVWAAMVIVGTGAVGAAATSAVLVTVVVSKGPAPRAVPDLTGLDLLAVRRALARAEAGKSLAAEDVEGHGSGPSPDGDVGEHGMKGMPQPRPRQDVLHRTRRHHAREEVREGFARPVERPGPLQRVADLISQPLQRLRDHHH